MVVILGFLFASYSPDLELKNPDIEKNQQPQTKRVPSKAYFL